MRTLGWILALATVGLVASTRRSGVPDACTPAVVDRANRLLLLADAELGGAPLAEQADPTEMSGLADQIDRCNLPGGAQAAADLRSKATLLRARRAGTVGPGLPGGPGIPGLPGTPPPGGSNLDILRQQIGVLIAQSQQVDPSRPEAAAMLASMDALAAQLDAQGLANEAAQVRAAAAALRLRSGGALPGVPAVPGVPPIAPPATPAADTTAPAGPTRLPDVDVARIQAIMARPDVEPLAANMEADVLAIRFPGDPSILDTIGQLRRRANALRSGRPPPTLQDAIHMLQVASSTPTRVSPAEMLATAELVDAQDDATAAALRTRASEVARARGITA